MNKNVSAFVKANDASPVTAGHAIGKGGQGGVYTLDDGTSFTLSAEDCRLLPPGYPKWPWDINAVATYVSPEKQLHAMGVAPSSHICGDAIYFPHTVLAAILAERERCANALFNRNGFMTANTENGKHFVNISFASMEEMHEFRGAMAALAAFKTEV